MALVYLNAKEATTVAMRTLSGLKGNEKKDFPNYFKELGQFSNSFLVDSDWLVIRDVKALQTSG